MIELEKLLDSRVQDILGDPALLIPMLKYYSKIYLGGGAPATCSASHRRYYIRLKQDGIQRLEKIMQRKYHLKPGKFIQLSGEVYNEGNLTDEIAKEVIGRFPKLKEQFIIKEQAEVKEPEQAPEAKEPEQPEQQAPKPEQKQHIPQRSKRKRR